MKIRILAIDPGASGGIAELHTDSSAVAHAMMDDSDLRDYMESFAQGGLLDGVRTVCYMELVGGYIAGNAVPGSAMFNFGDGYGYIRGLLAAHRIETRLVRPQTWQAGIPGVRGEKDKGTRKRALKEHAARLFPSLKVTLKTADALLIADYGRREQTSGLAMPEPINPAACGLVARVG
jgi:hypothetical protein